MTRPEPRTSAAPLVASDPGEGRDNLAGGMWMLLSVLSATVMTLAVREMSTGVDSRMVVFLRSGGVTLCIVAMALVWPAFRRQLRFSSPKLHLLRGGLIAVGTQMGYYAISALPLATATVLFFTAPIFATVLAGPVNGETVGPRRWAAVLAGFAGALIILRPGLGAFDPAMLSALGSSLLFATVLSLSRGLAQADGPISALASSMALTALLGLPLALPVWDLPEGTLGWGVFVLLLASSAGRTIGDLQGYRHGEASVMGVISYSRLVLIGLAAWLLFGEVPDLATWIGGAVIISATLYIAQREARRGRARVGPRAGPAD
ncbi:MAG: DMT family transporter [Pseudomonadota bacterium]